MTVLVPADAIEIKKATEAMVDYIGPVYLRVPNGPTPMVYENDSYSFEIGKAATLKEGTDICIIATGTMVADALDAANILSAEGTSCRVVNIHTIKPIDEGIIIKAAKETKALIIAEEHSRIGGLGSAVSEVLVDNNICIKMKRLGINDMFGESGSPEQLKEFHNLNASEIVNIGKNLV